MTSAFTNVRVAVSGLTATKAMLESAKPDADAEYRVKADTEYAIYVEYGTSKMEAQPYLRPAIRSTMREADALANQADSVDELVELIANRIAEKAQTNAPVDTGRLQNSIEAEEV